MKASTKFLLTVAAAGLTLPLIAADCFASDSNIGEGEGEGEEGEGEEGEGEGEGEEPDCNLDDFGPGTLTTDGDATITPGGINAVVCVTAGQQELFDVDVTVLDGNFANEVDGTDVEISSSQLNGGNPTSCSNSPTSIDIGGDLGVLVTCPVCLTDGDTLDDIAIQVTDNDGALTDAVCGF